MQGTDFFDEYVETDPVTGEKKTLTLNEKEKLYLECLDAYYNDGGKQLLSNDGEHGAANAGRGLFGAARAPARPPPRFHPADARAFFSAFARARRVRAAEARPRL